MTDETSEGTDITVGESTTSTDMVAENNATNNPENNKKLAEIVMMESIRDKYKLTFNMPDVFKGLHTNKFMYMELSDQFYEKHYEDIINAIKDTKFTRYAGFEKGRFFVEKYVWGGGKKGKHSKITVNPLANNYSSYMKAQQDAEKALISAMNNGTGSEGGGGLTQMNGNDCTPTIEVDTTDFDIEKTAKYKIGNSNANYAQDTANMSGKQAILDVFKRFSYDFYYNNRHCPQKMWNKTGRIVGNCGDIARLIMCIGQVHGMKVGCHFRGDHWYNLIEVNGKTYRFDCCFQSRRGYTSPAYGGEMCNNLVFLNGPWSGDI